MKKRLLFVSRTCARQLLTVAAVVLFATGAGAQTYTITDLGTFGPNSDGNYSVAYSINTSGQIGGSSSAPSSKITDPAFIYNNGTLTNIGTLGGSLGEGRSINASGQIAGYSTLANGSYRAFLYSGGQMTDIGTLGADYAVAYGINDAGDVVGNSDPVGQMDHAFLYSNGVMTNLGTLGGDTSTAYDINNLGVVCGYSYDAHNNFLGFTWQNGIMTPIGTLGGDWSIAYAINDQNRSRARPIPAGTAMPTPFSGPARKW